MGTRKQFMQHVMRILARMSLQGVARKLEAERLQRLLPTAQRQPGAVDQRPLDVKNHQPTTNSHGNRLGRRQLRHHRTRRLLHPAYLDNAAASLEFPAAMSTNRPIGTCLLLAELTRQRLVANDGHIWASPLGTPALFSKRRRLCSYRVAVRLIQSRRTHQGLAGHVSGRSKHADMSLDCSCCATRTRGPASAR